MVTGTVSLKSALRAEGCLSVRSRLNRGSEHPIPGGVQAEELRCASKILQMRVCSFLAARKVVGAQGPPC